MNGKREGFGVTFFTEGESLGKFGVLRWEGEFVNDKPHGKGQAYVAAEKKEGDERWIGDTAVRGPEIEFENGKTIDFP